MQNSRTKEAQIAISPPFGLLLIRQHRVESLSLGSNLAKYTPRVSFRSQASSSSTFSAILENGDEMVPLGVEEGGTTRTILPGLIWPHTD